MKKIALTIPDISSMVDFDSDSRSTSCSARLAFFDAETGYLSFNTHCTASRNDWNQEIQLYGWGDIVTPDVIEKNPDWDWVKTEFPEVLHLHARVNCDCPAFTYWGSVFNLSREDSALEPNTIPPSAVNERGELIRDPDSRYSCKHLAAVYNRYFT